MYICVYVCVYDGFTTVSSRCFIFRRVRRRRMFVHVFFFIYILEINVYILHF